MRSSLMQPRGTRQSRSCSSTIHTEAPYDLPILVAHEFLESRLLQVWLIVVSAGP